MADKKVSKGLPPELLQDATDERATAILNTTLLQYIARQLWELNQNQNPPKSKRTIGGIGQEIRTLPPYQEWLKERISWFERAREVFSPVDERLDYIAMALEQLVHVMGAAPAAPPTISIDGKLDTLLLDLGNLNENLRALAIALGTEPVLELPKYEYEQIRKTPSVISAGNKDVIWRTERKVESGEILFIKIVSDIADVKYSMFVDSSREIVFDIEELDEYDIDEAHPGGAWLEKAEVGTYAIIIAGPYRYTEKFILQAENAHASDDLTIAILDILRKRVA